MDFFARERGNDHYQFDARHRFPNLACHTHESRNYRCYKVIPWPPSIYTLTFPVVGAHFPNSCRAPYSRCDSQQAYIWLIIKDSILPFVYLSLCAVEWMVCSPFWMGQPWNKSLANGKKRYWWSFFAASPSSWVRFLFFVISHFSLSVWWLNIKCWGHCSSGEVKKSSGASGRLFASLFALQTFSRLIITVFAPWFFASLSSGCLTLLWWKIIIRNEKQEDEIFTSQVVEKKEWKRTITHFQMWILIEPWKKETLAVW